MRHVESRPVSRDPLSFAASPLPGGAPGAVLRVAGPDAEHVGRWLRERLTFVPELLGDDPWARKW